jgi:choice-of-anchor B domain-containing protein
MFFPPRRRVLSIGIILIGLIFVLHGVNNRSVAQETMPENGGLTAVMQAFLKDQEPPQALNALAATPCVGGLAGPYPCDKVDLLAFMPLGDIGGGSGNDIWGWTGCSNREFALMGRSSGTSFVEITDPENPIYLGNLPTQTANSSWRDIKTYADHAFIVSEASAHGMQVFDLTQLCNIPSPPITFSNTAHYSGFGSAHNIVINEDTGFAYAVGTGTCSGGLDMVNINTPASPTNAGCFSADGYTHDAQCIVYNGPDAAYVGQEICFNYNEDTLTIVNVTDKNSPVQISRTGYSGSAYTHQGWITEDHTYVLQDDELDEQNFGHNTRTRIWDVSDLDNPSIIGAHDSNNPAIDHNQYIKGDYAYQSNYRAGLRILNIIDIANGNLSEEAYFDIYPANNNASFSGSWSNYPYFDSGVVIVSGIGEGLFIVQPSLTADFTLTASPNALAICMPNDAVYEVSVGSFNGFNDNVALSASGEPAGTTTSLSNNNMTPPYTSTLTIGNTGAATPGDYAIDIVGMSVTSTQTTTVQLSLADGVPNATTLIAPPDAATSISATPIFSWTAVADATSYLLEVSTDMAFTTIVYSATISPPDTTHTSAPLDFDTTYYWRVTVNKGSVQTESAIFSFSTIDTSGMCADGTYVMTTYETDLEDGAPGWTHSGTGDSWVLSGARTTSGVNAWFAEDPAALSDQRLVSPPIYVPTPGEASAPILQFQNYQAFETPDTDGRCWDAGILEITTDGGTNWSQVPNASLLTDPYDNIIWNDTPGNNPISNDYGATDAWCNPGQDFLNSIVDISAYAGQTVQFRWRLGSDSFVGNEGWYLDDVKVTACTTTAPEIVVEPTALNSCSASRPCSMNSSPTCSCRLCPRARCPNAANSSRCTRCAASPIFPV